MLDSSPGGAGALSKEVYKKPGKKAVFQAGGKDSVADVFFHGRANYKKGPGADYLKPTSRDTAGLVRTVDHLDRAAGVEKVAVTIIRRAADHGGYHRGPTNALQVDKAPGHQAADLITVMPRVEAASILVRAPATRGHIIAALATPRKDIGVDGTIALFKKRPGVRRSASPRASRGTHPCSAARATSATPGATCARRRFGPTRSSSRAGTSCAPSTSPRRPRPSPRPSTPSGPP
jgi:glyceraldehyde-3-phosphate dehydrogenase (NAD(P))